MPLLSRAETQFLRRHLEGVCHITLDPQGPGAVRIHLVPSRHQHTDVPFVAILNGRDILPLSVSWAILLTNLMEALRPFEGKQMEEEEWQQAADDAVKATAAVYKRTPPEQIAADLQSMLDSLFAIARGETPETEIQPMDLGAYARHMAAPHRMDLLISAMVKDGGTAPGTATRNACTATPPASPTARPRSWTPTSGWLSSRNAGPRVFPS